MDVMRAVAHFIILGWMLYLAIDEYAARRPCRAWMWAALAVERFAFLGLLVLDVSRSGQLWMEWRSWLTPFIFTVAVALSVYGISRIRGRRRLRREIAPLLSV
jgi:hypothetical protein